MNDESEDLNDSIGTEVRAAHLETTYVHDVYEAIAHHFSSTRHKPWPKVAEFVASLPVGSLLLDVGCGNGKYFGSNPDIVFVGCDRSLSLTSICGQRGFQVFASDAHCLPIRSDSFDACLCIAVVHHFATACRRMEVIAEMARVLRPGGRALIYVWAMEQKGIEDEASNYVKVSREIKCDQPVIGESVLPIHVNRTNFRHQDVLVPWHLKVAKDATTPECEEQTSVFHRYYHVFRKGELEDLCQVVQDLEVVNGYYDKGNWCVVVQKPS